MGLRRVVRTAGSHKRKEKEVCRGLGAVRAVVQWQSHGIEYLMHGGSKGFLSLGFEAKLLEIEDGKHFRFRSWLTQKKKVIDYKSRSSSEVSSPHMSLTSVM